MDGNGEGDELQGGGSVGGIGDEACMWCEDFVVEGGEKGVYFGCLGHTGCVKEGWRESLENFDDVRGDGGGVFGWVRDAEDALGGSEGEGDAFPACVRVGCRRFG